ncbi:MAG: hypothetical protein WC280_01995 [Patescibacteria group bacterium]
MEMIVRKILFIVAFAIMSLGVVLAFYIFNLVKKYGAIQELSLEIISVSILLTAPMILIFFLKFLNREDKLEIISISN